MKTKIACHSLTWSTLTYCLYSWILPLLISVIPLDHSVEKILYHVLLEIEQCWLYLTQLCFGNWLTGWCGDIFIYISIHISGDFGFCWLTEFTVQTRYFASKSWLFEDLLEIGFVRLSGNLVFVCLIIIPIHRHSEKWSSWLSAQYFHENFTIVLIKTGQATVLAHTLHSFALCWSVWSVEKISINSYSSSLSV